MSDKENFAKWLTDNAHLKGTPEWDSVAKAFTEVDMFRPQLYLIIKL